MKRKGEIVSEYARGEQITCAEGRKKALCVQRVQTSKLTFGDQAVVRLQVAMKQRRTSVVQVENRLRNVQKKTSLLLPCEVLIILSEDPQQRPPLRVLDNKAKLRSYRGVEANPDKFDYVWVAKRREKEHICNEGRDAFARPRLRYYFLHGDVDRAIAAQEDYPISPPP